MIFIGKFNSVLNIRISNMRIAKILIKLSAIVSLMTVASTGNAALSCKNVTYGNNEYFDDYMEKIAIEARLTDGYFHRYHESVVSDLCNNKDSKDIEWMIETGYVPRSEVQAIKEVLGLDKQYLQGVRYQKAKQRFSDELDLGHIGGQIIADYYIFKPDSKCGKLAKSALEGNNQSIKILQSFPSYCQ